MRKPFWFFTSYNRKPANDWGFSSLCHLDMGCGAKVRNPFMAPKLIGADVLTQSIVETQLDYEYLELNPTGEIPLPNESVESISGFDFIEHLHRGSQLESNFFIKFMNEAGRVLRNGGVLILVTPAFPSPLAFQDPTHVNFITEQTVHYFVGQNPGATNNRYGYSGKFELIAQQWVGPFSKVWIPNPNMNDKDANSFGEIIRQLMWTLRKPTRIRALIAQVRKPSHLLWVLRKI